MSMLVNMKVDFSFEILNLFFASLFDRTIANEGKIAFLGPALYRINYFDKFLFSHFGNRHFSPWCL